MAVVVWLVVEVGGVDGDSSGVEVSGGVVEVAGDGMAVVGEVQAVSKKMIRKNFDSFPWLAYPSFLDLVKTDVPFGCIDYSALDRIVIISELRHTIGYVLLARRFR